MRFSRCLSYLSTTLAVHSDSIGSFWNLLFATRKVWVYNCSQIPFLSVQHISGRLIFVRCAQCFLKERRRHKLLAGIRGLAPPRNYLDFYSLKSPFLSYRVIQMGYWPDVNLESVLTIKDIFIMKNVTNFRKKGETGVDLRLI